MKNILLILSSVLLFAGCKKSVDELPAATETGANSFGLKLDGAYWVPQKFGVASTAPLVEGRMTGTGDLVINARNFASSPTETEFEIYIKNATGPGTYLLNENTDVYPGVVGSYGYFVKRRINPLNEWITSTQYTGSVTITKLDLTNKIAAGTFQFTAGSMDGTASPINVTDGRFDVKLQ